MPLVQLAQHSLECRAGRQASNASAGADQHRDVDESVHGNVASDAKTTSLCDDEKGTIFPGARRINILQRLVETAKEEEAGISRSVGLR